MADFTIGTCSLCGGAVRLPAAWYGTVPPIPTCASCGATAKQPHGPVVDMESSRTLTSDRFIIPGRDHG